MNIDKSDLKIDDKIFFQVDKLTYKILIQDVNSLLNLKDSNYALTIINEIANRNTK